MAYVRTIACKMCQYNVNALKDCISIAYMALIEAVDKYNKTKGASLKTYINIKVHYAIIDYFQSLQRSSVEIYSDDYSLLNVPSLINEDLIINRLHLFNSIKHMPLRTASIFYYYMEGHTQKTISEIFNISETRVSQIIKRSLKELK